MQKRRQTPYLCGLRQIVTLVTPKNMTPVKKNKKIKTFVKSLTKFLKFLFPIRKTQKLGVTCNKVR